MHPREGNRACTTPSDKDLDAIGLPSLTGASLLHSLIPSFKKNMQRASVIHINRRSPGHPLTARLYKKFMMLLYFLFLKVHFFEKSWKLNFYSQKFCTQSRLMTVAGSLLTFICSYYATIWFCFQGQKQKPRIQKFGFHQCLIKYFCKP